ncbi:MAG: DUF1405 domain-containing protein [Promethearchaeota archaeon]
MLEELKNRDFWLSPENQREFVKSLFKFLPFTITISVVIFIASYFSLWKYFFPDGPGLSGGPGQLPLTDWPFILWFFVIDCPVYGFLFFFFVYEHGTTREGWKLWAQQLLFGILWIGLLKASVFGVGAFLSTATYQFLDGTLTLLPLLLGLVNAAAHISMVIAAIVIIPFLSVNRRTLTFFGFWMVLNDFLDYFPIFFPISPNWPPTLSLWRATEPLAPILFVFTIATDLILFLILFKIYKKTGNISYSNSEE